MSKLFKSIGCFLIAVIVIGFVLAFFMVAKPQPVNGRAAVNSAFDAPHPNAIADHHATALAVPNSAERGTSGKLQARVFDLAADGPRAIDKLAEEISREYTSFGGRRWRRSVRLSTTTSEDASSSSYALTRQLESALQGRGILVGGSADLAWNLRIERTIDPVQQLEVIAGTSIDPPFARYVAVNAAMGGDKNSSAGRHELVLRIKTSVQWTREDSEQDALDALERRIHDELVRYASARHSLDRADEGAFRTKLRERYYRDLLIAQGEHRVATEERKVDDQVYYESYASWGADSDRLERISGSIVDEMRFNKTLPFIRAGLCLGALVLAIVGWLKLDWWLKGHNSFLTKLLCATLWLITVGLIWSYPIHG